MTPQHLQDRIARGQGIAARHTGHPHDAFRPSSNRRPLAPENRYLRLPVTFNNEDPRFTRAAAANRPARYGIFDSAYTRPGDYLVGPGGAYFIAAQDHLLPPLCILANAAVTVLRPNTAATPGLVGYSGVSPSDMTVLLESWPAALLAERTGGVELLPADGSPGLWTILLPPMPHEIRTSDIVTDDQSRSFVVATSTRTSQGLHLTAKQATT